MINNGGVSDAYVIPFEYTSDDKTFRWLTECPLKKTFHNVEVNTDYLISVGSRHCKTCKNFIKIKDGDVLCGGDYDKG